ncbi:hypothetical protein L227DRAFT_573050 [Lentinus tigrinus ALCF2SS1-6]|uniref:Uncharacterized protein n=1 Tax=Lentinus tigrinus ALCF2SS1-6 TaxID=1328759 RepID=A0A5C2SJ87_9APHY|nr:hypothetical protein L227DRAFT_573050 [Lentinus tigrinus ALCF2SS1-6]
MLTFSPALGSTTTLDVPPIPSHGRGRSPVVYFKATFDSPESFAKAKSDGARVELWTNLPIEGSPAGEWKAVAFTELDHARSDDATAGEFGTLEDRTIYLRLRAPLQDQVGARFDFTYRLLYPSGHVQWLGEHDNNGVVAVKQGLPGIDLMGGWDVGSDGAYHLGSSVVEGAVGGVLQVADWAVWTWNTAGIPTCLQDGEAVTSNALVLLPRRPTCGISVPGPVALMGDKSTRLHLSSDGTLSIQPSGATGSISASDLEYSSELLQEALSAYGGTILLHNSAFLVIATHRTTALPLHLLVVPSLDATQDSVSLPWQTLQPLLSNAPGKIGLVLFSPRTSKLQIVRGPVLGDDSGALVVGFLGDAFVVSPVEIVSADEKTWLLGLLAPTNSVSWTIERPRHPLPTPPPSPPAREPSRPNSPPIAPVPSVPPQQPQHCRRASLTLVRNLPARLLRAYVHAVFNVIFWFWNVFFRALVVRVIGERFPRRISDILGLVLSKTTSPAPSPDQRLKSAPEDKGRNALQDHAERHGRELGTPSASNLPAPKPKHVPPRHQSHPMQIVSHVVFSAILEGRSELPFLVLQGDLPKGLHATLDGKALPTPTAVRSGDGIFLVKFAGLTGGGRLDVFLDL